ncbi:MAG: TPM domain-containing protein, partial [Pseudomonadota bacterium]
LTDLDSRRIIDNLMTPAFRSGDFGGGVEAAVNAISGAIRGEAGAIPAASTVAGSPVDRKFLLGFFALFMLPFARQAVAMKGRQWWVTYLFMAIFLFLYLFGVDKTVALIVVTSWLLLIPPLRYIWPEAWRIEAGTGSGSGSGGSGGGGGFSGGGGSFGGGGASGRW